MKHLQWGGVAEAVRTAVAGLHGTSVRATVRAPVARRGRPARTAGQRVVVEEQARRNVERDEDVNAVVLVRQQYEEQR